jgi:hypothetical protein
MLDREETGPVPEWWDPMSYKTYLLVAPCVETMLGQEQSTHEPYNLVSPELETMTFRTSPARA